MTEQIKSQLEKRSIIMIFVARHLFYIRTVTFLTCGAVKMSFKRFLFADAAAALISAPLMMLLGYLFAENYETLISGLKTAKEWSMIAGVLVIVAIYVIYKRSQKVLEEKN